MNPMHRELAIRTIQEDLSTFPELLAACLAILDYICAQPEQNLRHITYGALTKATKLEDINYVVQASRYLIGARVPILDLEFEFIDGDLIEQIPQEDVSEAMNKGVFYHPVTGERVENFDHMLYSYFKVSQNGLELRKN